MGPPVEVQGKLMNNGEVNEWKIGEGEKERGWGFGGRGGGVNGGFFYFFFGEVSNCLAV